MTILGTKTYGSLVIVRGKTEPGANVTINKESVPLNRDGSFRKTVQIYQEGWTFVEIVTTDAWENQASESVRVFIDAY